MTADARDATAKIPVAVVLDKDPFFRDFQVFLLSRNGYEVRVPTSPEEFSATWVHAQAPDVVVTEILLPGKNGLELTSELKAATGKRCPVVVYSVLRAQERALAAGADRFLLKPLLRESYLSALEDATKRST